jgi:DNA-binding CsgD family transcriptional regulator/tetratricopeptide (TPR) repeat protein
MGRSALRHPDRAAPPARQSHLAATVRRLDDGSLALIVGTADAHLLRDADRSGATLTVQVARGSFEDAARDALAAGARTLAAGPLGDAYATFTQAAALASETAPALAVTAITAAAGAAWSAGDRRACTDALAAARHLLEPDAGQAFAPLLDYLTGLRGLVEETPGAAIAPLGRVLARADEDDAPDALHRASVAALLLGDAAASARIGMRALAAARSQGRDDLVPQTLEYLAYAEMRAGRHAPARAHALDGLAAALRSGRVNTAAHHRAVLALTASVEGDTAEVEAQAAQALAVARRHRLAQTGTLAEWALARADLSRGRPEAAASRLQALVRPGGGHFAVRPLLMPCFIEAAVLAGSPEAARPVAEELRLWAGFGIDRGAFAALARSQALLDGGDGAGAHFRRALQLHPADGGDFERARTLLLYGKWLRRRRQPGRARTVLREALHAFERCGAAGWAGQATEELRATGGRSRAAEHPVAPGGEGLASLTPHQRRIAELVATGATNREVAQSLSLSVRTVDHHLRNIFAALGVRSRVELARLVPRA